MRFGRRPDAKLMKGFEQELQDVSQDYILFTSFEDDVKRLKGSLASAKQEEEVAAIKACFQEFYLIENIVRRLESHEQHLAEVKRRLVEEMVFPQDTAAALRRMMNQVSKEVEQLLQTMALFDTQIRSYLEFLQASIKRQEHLEQAQQVLVELDDVANRSMQWLAYVRKDIQKARKQAKDFIKEFAVMSIDDITEKIHELPAGARISYLLQVMEQKGMMPKLSEMIPLVIRRVQSGADSLIIIERLQELRGMTPPLWKLAGDCFMQLERFTDAASCYTHRGNREGNILSAAAYLKAGIRDMANICLLDAEVTEQEALAFAEKKVKRVY